MSNISTSESIHHARAAQNTNFQNLLHEPMELTTMQTKILEAFQRHPEGMTDEDILALPVFEDTAPSTVRTRRKELIKLGKLMYGGARRNDRGRNTQIWRVVP